MWKERKLKITLKRYFKPGHICLTSIICVTCIVSTHVLFLSLHSRLHDSALQTHLTVMFIMFYVYYSTVTCHSVTYCLHPVHVVIPCITLYVTNKESENLEMTHLIPKGVSICSVLFASFGVIQLHVVVRKLRRTKILIFYLFIFILTCTEDINLMMPPSRPYSQSVRPPPPPPYSGPGVFCTGENVTECIQYISKASTLDEFYLDRLSLMNVKST